MILTFVGNLEGKKLSELKELSKTSNLNPISKNEILYAYAQRLYLVDNCIICENDD